MIETEGHESDTEKGLTADNTQLYRFNKYVSETNDTLIEAQPYLWEWFAHPDNENPLEKINVLATRLHSQANRIEIWQKQIDAHNSSAVLRLRQSLQALASGSGELITKNEKIFGSSFVGNISHPACRFLNGVESLSEIIKS